MSVYFIASYDIEDPAGYENYVPGVVPLLQKHGAKVLVADYEARPMEGRPARVSVVLRFASEEAAMAWYDDPDYAPVRQIRFDSTSNGSAVLAQEFVPPSE